MAHNAVKRAHSVLAIARKMAQELDRQQGLGLAWGEGTRTFRYSNRIEEIQLYSFYSEMGYTDPASGVIAVGNWNAIDKETVAGPKDLMLRLEKIFERLGVELEWSDEWTSCHDCSGLVRTQPDCMWWTPSYVADLDKGELLCRHCALTCDCPTENH